MRCLRHLAIAALALATGAHAHDTWFAPQGEGLLALGTGNRFPVTELAVDDKYFARSGCRVADGRLAALEKVRFTDKATLLRIRGGEAGSAQSCFVQLAPFEFDVPPDKVQVYFDEIRPRPEVLAAWAALKARGLPFHERYTKSARIELGAATAAQPVGIAMDVLRSVPAGALAVGGTAEFQVLRDGRPLPDFPVELVNERSPVGLWQRTDAQGRFRIRLPLPGRWLLRGTDLHVVAGEPARFESWFLSYAFDVAR